MEDYFINCRNEEERKILYRQLAQKYHPDKPGGSNEIMKEINKQYKNPGNYSDFRTETKTNTTNNRQGKDTAPPWQDRRDHVRSAPCKSHKGAGIARRNFHPFHAIP